MGWDLAYREPSDIWDPILVAEFELVLSDKTGERFSRLSDGEQAEYFAWLCSGGDPEPGDYERREARERGSAAEQKFRRLCQENHLDVFRPPRLVDRRFLAFSGEQKACEWISSLSQIETRRLAAVYRQFGKKGWPDYIVRRRGHSLEETCFLGTLQLDAKRQWAFVEVKSGMADLKKDQERCFEALKQIGFPVFIFRNFGDERCELIPWGAG